VRIRDREPLRSASPLLGFTMNARFWDPGPKVVAGPSRGPLCFQDSGSPALGSFLGRHIVSIEPYPAFIASPTRVYDIVLSHISVRSLHYEYHPGTEHEALLPWGEGAPSRRSRSDVLFLSQRFSI
jgi:hypothetical protein